MFFVVVVLLLLLCLELGIEIPSGAFLMVGKIVGIGAAGLTQMVCVVAVGIGALLLQNPLQAALFGANSGGMSLNITGISITFLLLLLIFHGS